MTRLAHAVLALAFAAPLARAQSVVEPSAQPDPRWLSWIGCWAPTGASAEAVPDATGTHRVCIVGVPGSTAVDLVKTIANGQIVERDRIEATGQQRPVSRAGCAGWESAEWSPDGERLYRRSALTCDGGIQRVTSGMVAMASPSDWVDIEVADVRGEKAIRIVRYHEVDDTTALARQAKALVQTRELARRSARTAASAPPTIDDVIEATRELDAVAVEAWLHQRKPRFDVGRKELERLADSDVPDGVIDLLVALANPRFLDNVIDGRAYALTRIVPPRTVSDMAIGLPAATPTVELVLPEQNVSGGATYDRDDRSDRYDDDDDYRRSGGYDRYDHFDRYDYLRSSFFSPYLYSPFGPSFFWPSNLHPFLPYRPTPNRLPPRVVIIVTPPRPATPATPAEPPPPRPRMIRGVGYTQGLPGTDGAGTATPPATTPPRNAIPRGPAQQAQTDPQPRVAVPRVITVPPATSSVPVTLPERRGATDPKASNPRNAAPRGGAEPTVSAPPPPRTDRAAKADPTPEPARATPPAVVPPRTAKVRPPK
jgi:hypothetical protein